MDQGDLVRCWSVDQYNQVGIVLEHDKKLKKVKVYFQNIGKTKTLYSRDVQIVKRCPINVERIKEELDNS